MSTKKIQVRRGERAAKAWKVGCPSLDDQRFYQISEHDDWMEACEAAIRTALVEGANVELEHPGGGWESCGYRNLRALWDRTVPRPLAPDVTRYPLALIRVAHAYAESFSHSWSGLEIPATGTWVDATEFDSACERFGECDGWPGIYSPDIAVTRYGDGAEDLVYDVEHRSTSGRYRWHLQCDARYPQRVLVAATIARPAGPVAEFTADVVEIDGEETVRNVFPEPAERLDLDRRDGFRRHDCGFYERHLEALRRVMYPALRMHFRDAERTYEYIRLATADIAVDDEERLIREEIERLTALLPRDTEPEAACAE